MKRSVAVFLSILMIFSSLLFSAGAEGESHDHNYVGVVTVTPTCKTTGIMTYTCQACDENSPDRSYTVVIGIDPTNHDFVYKTTVEPTCSQEGYDIEICSRCGVSRDTNRVNPLGHQYEQTTSAPTCIEDGGITYTCTVCNETEPGHQYFISKEAALGHDFGDFSIVEYGDAYAMKGTCQREGCDETTYQVDANNNVQIYYRVDYVNNYKTSETEVAPDGTTIAVGFEDEILFTEYVLSGTASAFDGKEPSRDVTYDYGAYSFTGWDTDGASLENVTQNITAKAVFEGEDTEHWVAFYNPDGKKFKEVRVAHGAGTTAPDENPTYAPVGFFNYSFSRWNKDNDELSHIYSNCFVTALYDEVGKTYKIYYCDGDGTGSIIDSEVFHYGDAPQHNPVNLVREADETYYYSFSGKWNYRYEAPSGESTAMFTTEYSVERLLCPAAVCLDCNKGYDHFEYDPIYESDPDNEAYKYMTDIEKGIIRVYADYYTRAKQYYVRIVAVDSDGDPIYNGGSIQILNSNGNLYGTATLSENADVILRLTYDKFYTIQISYMGEAAQQTITLDERNLNPDSIPTVRMMLGSPADIQEDHTATCSCICHRPLIGRIYIAFLNIVYRLTGKKTVCCYDMYEKHGDQLVYTA